MSLDQIESNRALPAIAELRAIPQWVAWRLKDVVAADGTRKQTKPPVNPKRGGGASHSDPETWGTFDQARIFARTRRLAGIGFVLSENDPFTGIDLDKCRDPATGVIDPWAQAILDMGETYAEISPSGTGIRMIARGKIEAAVKCDPAHVEMYGKQRYLTITANHLPGTPKAIAEAPRTIEALRQRAAEHQAKAEAETKAAHPERAAPPAPKPGLNFFGKRDPKRERPASAKPKSDNFFRAVNNKALANIGAWAPVLFPAAKHQSATGAWRVPSRALRRSLEEDISIAPDGIVDFGVHDMGDARQGKRTAIDLVMEWGDEREAIDAAMWLCDRLGVAPESLGWRERAGPEEEALSREVDRADDGTLYYKDTGEIIATPEPQAKAETALAESDDLPEHLTWVPGLMGEIIDRYMDTTSTPSRIMALTSAIALVGVASGRCWATPTRSGTHFYLAVLAATGKGKQSILNMCTGAIGAMKARETLLGPSDFMSQSAVVNHVARKPLSLCPMDEFGGFLARVQSKRRGSSSFEQGISKVLRTIWGTNFHEMSTAAYAGKDAETIFAPALTLVGVAPPEEFWGALEGGDISNGFLNRFLVFSVTKLPPDQKPKIGGNEGARIPQSIVDKLRQIWGGGNDVGRGNASRSAHQITDPHIIDFANPEAEAIYYEYRRIATSRFEGTDKAHLTAHYARAAENAVRLATVYALSVSQTAPRVTIEAMQWGRDVAEWVCSATARGANLYLAENETQENANRIKRILREAPDRMMRRSDIMAKLNNRLRRRDFDDALAMMDEAGQILRVAWKEKEAGTEDKSKRGPKPQYWMLAPNQIDPH